MLTIILTVVVTLGLVIVVALMVLMYQASWPQCQMLPKTDLEVPMPKVKPPKESEMEIESKRDEIIRRVQMMGLDTEGTEITAAVVSVVASATIDECFIEIGTLWASRTELEAATNKIHGLWTQRLADIAVLLERKGK